ncbi:MAG: hypothetical protein MJ228_00575 [Bacilli bacterium]|nr:hypothetical protein [Bacilli bacterium]
MTNEKKNNEIEETTAFEPTEEYEDYDPKKDRKGKILWAVFFSVVIVLMVVCLIVIKTLK